MGTFIVAATLENSLTVPEMLNIELLYDLQIPFLSVYSKETKTYQYQNMYTDIYSSIIYNSQKVKTIQISHNWVNKLNVVYVYNGIVWCNRKEYSTDIYYNMNGPQKQCAK